MMIDLNPEQIENLKIWKISLQSEHAKDWALSEEEAEEKIRNILSKTNFEQGGDLTAEDFDELFRAMKKFSANRALSNLLYRNVGLGNFNRQLRNLYYGKEPFAKRVDDFFKMKGTGIQTLSQFLVAFDSRKYALVTSQIKEVLNLDSSQEKSARKEALERYKIQDLTQYMDKTIEFLADNIVFEAIKAATGLEKYTLVNNLLWDGWQKSKEKDDQLPFTLNENLKDMFDNFRNQPFYNFLVKVRYRQATKIKNILSDVDSLDLDKFNHEIWRLESQTLLNGENINIYKMENIQNPLTITNIVELNKALETDDLELHGNYVWGSATKIYFPHNKNEAEKINYIKNAASILNNKDATPYQKAKNILEIPGFGRNISTGLVMLIHPDEFAIFNKQSEGALKKLNLDTTDLEAFERSVSILKNKLGVESFLELDLFLFLINIGIYSMHVQVKPQIWWVNQGTTLKAGLEGGFLWAPTKTKVDRSLFHWDTMTEVKKDDIVLHYANGALRYVSKVLEPAVNTPKPEAIKEEAWPTEGRLVKVDYHKLDPPIPLANFSNKVHMLNIPQGPLDNQGGVKQGYLFRFSPEALRIIYRSQPETEWPDFAQPPDIPTDGERQPNYTIDDFVKDTGFPPAVIDSWERKLLRKKHVVFQGPPGTGKTYIAERLARLMVSETKGFWDLVQFHPAYAYEDFMQGIRPILVGGGISYELVDGRFIEFCRKARKQADGAPCVLIIDEINRANLSRVFGELMYLLEYRNKEIPLASGGSLFRIPANVYIIGTMNTADRSIALVDHALRRRFSFIRLKPDYIVLKKHLETHEYPADELITVLIEINRAIDDPNYELGISFFMKEGTQLKAHLPDIWIGEIEPYLEEIFYDQPGKVEPFRWETLSQTKLKDVAI